MESLGFDFIQLVAQHNLVMDNPILTRFIHVSHEGAQAYPVSEERGMQNIKYLSPANEVEENVTYDLKALRAPVLDGWKHNLFNLCLRSMLCGPLRNKLFKDSGFPRVILSIAGCGHQHAQKVPISINAHWFWSVTLPN